MANTSYIWQLKKQNPKTGAWDNNYLVPAVKDQNGIDYNYIIVCCDPQFNGVYKYKASNRFNYMIWRNNDLPCFYVPITDCEKINELENLNEQFKKKVIKCQNNWHKYRLKTKQIKRDKKPDWFLS